MKPNVTYHTRITTREVLMKDLIDPIPLTDHEASSLRDHYGHLSVYLNSKVMLMAHDYELGFFDNFEIIKEASKKKLKKKEIKRMLADASIRFIQPHYSTDRYVVTIQIGPF